MYLVTVQFLVLYNFLSSYNLYLLFLLSLYNITLYIVEILFILKFLVACTTFFSEGMTKKKTK